MNSFIDFLSEISLFGLSRLQLLGIYTAPGLSYASFHLFKEYRNRPSQFATDLLRALGKEKSIVDRVLNVLVYAIAIICVAIGWPLFGIWAIFESRKEAALEIERNKPDFDCAPEYLVIQVNPVDAEIASYVIDPLRTVPPLPFGHLNKAWGNFLADMTDDADEMWSFHIPKGSKTGKYQRECASEIRGFAKVRDGKILAEFITESD
ncbi:hypothetical protein G6725_02145 [Polynucleobacter paneuropaeus]|uniref:hypothetical protein n=1 Tax=Polynucleobacter sphagniphilus TaxID=1743169 RepID=UPI001BFDE743|nr:hypothetical protein [Polynucleobacter sphagniphilus]MBT8534808.1 hypothetical protein [Polynucleobacter paneuropaeus]MDH6241168.1 hypothetical protein [Polynucleobacter sphagniphilus]